MLILTRKANESIVIGDNIEVCISKIEGDLVRVGISAPRDIPVYRKELLEAIAESNQAAAAGASAASLKGLSLRGIRKSSGKGDG